jgi:hypothetical protein
MVERHDYHDDAPKNVDGFDTSEAAFRSRSKRSIECGAARFPGDDEVAIPSYMAARLERVCLSVPNDSNVSFFRLLVTLTTCRKHSAQ